LVNALRTARRTTATEAAPNARGRAWRLLSAVPMKFRWLSRRAREIVTETLLQDAETDVDRLLVAGAVVVRDGEHFRIETGDESWSELEAHARRLSGLCDCGAVLSLNGQRAHCRSCGREYLAP
jgi:hypothetical protein